MWLRTGGVRTHVKESVLKVDPGRKIPCRTGKWNLRQRRASPTLYQLSYIHEQNQEKIALNEPRWQKLERPNPWQQAKHAKLVYSDLLKVSQEGTIDSSQFSADGTLMSASVIPHQRNTGNRRINQEHSHLACDAIFLFHEETSSCYHSDWEGRVSFLCWLPLHIPLLWLREVSKFTTAASHKIDVVGESYVAYGPSTNVDGCVVVMQCFLRDLL